MQVWKLSETLTNPCDPDWDNLALLSLGSQVHSNRKKGFLLSRAALKECLIECGISLTISELTLREFHQIEGHPQFTISLSHSKDCGAALVADKNIYRSVGIDIESEDRVVKESIRERVSHPKDIALRNIELWCLKEAAFKALMNTGLFEKPIEFSSIIIKEGQWSHSPSALTGEWELDFIKPYVVARTYLKN
jgi:phosphopantetheinyl transferase (holo-ACP synthase)